MSRRRMTSRSSHSRPRSYLLKRSKVEKASGLPFHLRGPGTRYVFFDSRHTPGAGIYAIARCVRGLSRAPAAYVADHAHKVPSYYLFLGSRKRLSGLRAEVRLGGAVRRVSSPCGVFIPPRLGHSVRLLRGGGTFLHILLKEDYARSLVGERS